MVVDRHASLAAPVVGVVGATTPRAAAVQGDRPAQHDDEIGITQPGRAQTLARRLAIGHGIAARFERGREGYQFVEKLSWIPSLGVDYHFGIDGISLLLILLTTLMGVIAVAHRKR